jgi:hypothetical protein
MSHNPSGLHGLLTGIALPFTLLVFTLLFFLMNTYLRLTALYFIKLNSVALVRKRTIPTEWLLQIEGFAWQHNRSPRPLISVFQIRSCYFSIQVAPQLYSWGWVDPIPDPLLLRKSGSAGNRTQDLQICSQELGPQRRSIIFYTSAKNSFYKPTIGLVNTLP